MLTRLLFVLVIASTCQSKAEITWVPARVVSIEYPPLGTQSRTHGTVKIECALSPDGAVAIAKIASGAPLLGKAVLQRIGEWRFRMPESARSSSSSAVMLTFTFVLEDQASTTPKTKFIYEYPYSITIISQPFARTH